MFRYILVNERVPKDKVTCSYCKTPLGKSYVRDLSTRLVYHSPWCLDVHELETVRCIENHARQVN